ncbi:hypothetical protein OSK63_24695, partial [Escherichia coli]|nr:hypothetical protein [Escherichia coli]MDA6457181.1 hypothetical protein [Escherichia coli]MDA6513770.1 hypothetical protein [Escherichia coli]MDA6538308.1 hypothetical protein [Escherichia coli]MDA6752577.1 hypothetical protein [Escherichia coli]
KRVFLVILFTSFSGSLVSRIPGAVQNGKQAWLVCVAGLVWEIAQVHYYGKQTWLVFRINNGED